MKLRKAIFWRRAVLRDNAASNNVEGDGFQPHDMRMTWMVEVSLISV
jgi:hypothetical protein